MEDGDQLKNGGVESVTGEIARFLLVFAGDAFTGGPFLAMPQDNFFGSFFLFDDYRANKSLLLFLGSKGAG